MTCILTFDEKLYMWGKSQKTFLKASLKIKQIESFKDQCLVLTQNGILYSIKNGKLNPFYSTLTIMKVVAKNFIIGLTDSGTLALWKPYHDEIDVIDEPEIVKSSSVLIDVF